MYALLIVPLLAAGYYVVLNHPIYFARLNRYDGQLFYVDCTFKGLVCLSISLIVLTFFYYLKFDFADYNCWIHIHPYEELHKLLIRILTPIIPEEEKDHLDEILFFITLTITLFLVAFAWVKIWKYNTRRNLYKVINNPDLSKNQINQALQVAYQGIIISKAMSGTLLDQLILQSWSNDDKSLLLSLDNGKVYAGRVFEFGDANENTAIGEHIGLVPIVSGYREPNTHKVIFTTDYANTTESELFVIIKKSSIWSACIFSEDVINSVYAEESQ